MDANDNLYTDQRSRVNRYADVDMIRPKISPMTPDLVRGVQDLFDANDMKHLDVGDFNPWRTLVAVWKGEVVGVVVTWWDNQPIVWADLLLVDPRYRNQGIATWLLWTLEALVKEQGASCLRCVLDEDEGIAKPLERAGFSKVGKFLIMEKSYEV